MTRGKTMIGDCKGCGMSKLQARQLCTRCYDFARTQAQRLNLQLSEYLTTTADLRSPGRYTDQPHRHNRSGYRGCYLDRGKWRVQIRHRGKAIYLGRFDTVEQARAAYEIAQNRLRAVMTPLPPTDQKTRRHRHKESEVGG